MESIHDGQRLTRSVLIGGLLLSIIGGLIACTAQRSLLFGGAVPAATAGGVGDWPMEGQGPTRARAIQGTIAAPLRLDRTYPIGGDTQFVSPAVIANGVLFAEGEHALHALTLETGAESWRINLPGSFLSPVVQGDRVFVRAESGDDGYLYALSVDAGAKLWEFKFPSVGSAYDNIGGHVTAPVVADGMVLIGAADTLLAVDAEAGVPLWSVQIDAPIASSATVAGDSVYVADFTHLYALDIQTGELRWRFDHGAVSLFFAPIVQDGRVYIASYDTIFAVNRTTGQPEWSRRFDDIQMTPAAAADPYLFVKSPRRLFALNADDGAIVWEYGATNFVSLPALTTEQVYVITRADGGSQLRALQLNTGEELWRSDNAPLANAAPVAAGHAIYVRTVDGNVLAYGAAAD